MQRLRVSPKLAQKLRTGAQANRDSARLPHRPCTARLAARAAVGPAFGPRLSRLAGRQRRGRQAALATLEDPLVDRLVWRALKRGCGAVIARTPRAAIDCNRAEDEIDPSVVDGAAPRAGDRAGARRARHRARADPAAWLSVAARRSRPTQLDDRLDQAHRPYHDADRRSSSRCCSTASAALCCSIATRCRRRRPAFRRSCSATAAAAPPIRGSARRRWRSRGAAASRRGSTTRSPAAT